jgi:hypothetical protein
MVEMFLCVASPRQDGIARKLREPIDDDPERLTLGVGIERRKAKPPLRRFPGTERLTDFVR